MRKRDKRVLYDIIEYMNSEKLFYDISADIIELIAEYLGISNVYLLQKNYTDYTYDIVIGYDEDRYTLGKLPINGCSLFSDKSIYGNNNDDCYREVLCNVGAKEFISTPIRINGNIVMTLLGLCDDIGTFLEEDVEFISKVGMILEEIAQKKVNSQSVASTNDVLRDILANIGTAVVVYDINRDQIMFKNELAEKSRENINVCNDAIKLLKNYKQGFPKHVQEFYDSESGLWFEIKYSYINWIDYSKMILITAVDTTLKRKNSTKISFQAQNDFLTGLYNRMKCEADLKKEVDIAIKNNTKGALLFLDLDNFKNINDSLGHDYGDALLKEIGTTLHEIYGLRNHCYRMGGDEFVAIITPENYSILEKIITNASAAFNKSWYLIDSDCYCTMSMGVVEFPEHGMDVNTLVKKADIAMYDAKKSGKNQIAYYTSASNEEAVKKLEMESLLRQAVANDCSEFVVYYQPIVDTATGRCVGCESLVRWVNNALGFVSPANFIPMAEHLSLINDIGDHVLKTACYKCREWNEKYDPDFRVNVNLSVVQLMQKNVVEHLSSIIISSGVNPKNITLEITENMAINDLKRVLDIINGLKNIGIKIALDDFGTGYSSLNYIKQLNFDIIKIDKSFVDKIISDDYEKAFVKLMAGLSQQIGVKLCVEGIETSEQYKILCDLKAETVQGYYFSKPIPCSMFEEKFFVNE